MWWSRKWWASSSRSSSSSSSTISSRRPGGRGHVGEGEEVDVMAVQQGCGGRESRPKGLEGTRRRAGRSRCRTRCS